MTKTGRNTEPLDKLQASPQWQGNRFVNTLPKAPMSFWKTLGKWLRGTPNAEPSSALPIAERRRHDFDTAPASGLRVTWLGHSTSLVEIDGRRILLDPVWSKRASPFAWLGPKRFHQPPLPLAELPELDAVVISHNHFDHLDRETIIELGARIPLYVVPLGVGAQLQEWGVSETRIVELDWWQEHKLGELVLTATPARHFSGRSLIMTNQDKTLWAGWSIAGPQHRVYFSGDTAMCPEFREIGERLGPFDVTLIESGAYDALWPDVHIGPEQAIVAHQMLGGGLFMPVHWGTFNLACHAWTEPVERLLVAAERAEVSLAIPRPGESIEPARAKTVERWWPDLPWQRAEEDAVVSTGMGNQSFSDVADTGVAQSLARESR